MSALLLAYVAGALTTINPCVLPLLPVFVASAFGSSRFGVLALAAGLVAGFTTVGILVSATGTVLGLDPQTLRLAAAIMLVLAGAAFLLPVLERRVAALAAPVGRTGAALAQRASTAGTAGQFGIGLLAGAIWTPCSGPSLAAAFALALEAGGIPTAALRLFAFGLGAATVVALLAFGSRAALARRREILGSSARFAKPVAGSLFLLTGFAVYSGIDRWAEAYMLDLMPDWLLILTTDF